MVAVRCQGLALDSIIGIAVPPADRATSDEPECISIVSKEHLRILVRIANERFDQNAQRIGRFHRLIVDLRERRLQTAGGGTWEDAEARRARKRAEGLSRQEQVQKARLTEASASTQSFKDGDVEDTSADCPKPSELDPCTGKVSLARANDD